MNTYQVLSADFAGAIGEPGGEFNNHKFLEVAIVGRSNVGKSTLINRLLARKRLARTSSTPGRTQQLNFFQCRLRKGASQIRELLLVDLPGFGYAKMPKSEQRKIGELIFDYLSTRAQLRFLILLNDVRREPGEDELELRKLAFTRGVPVLIVLTKIDKVGKNELIQRKKIIASCYGLEVSDLVLAGEGHGCDELWERVWDQGEL